MSWICGKKISWIKWNFSNFSQFITFSITCKLFSWGSNFIFPDNSEIKNLLGYKGSFVADIFYQSIGLISLLFCITVLFTGIIIFYKKRISLIFGNFFYSIIYILIGSFFFTTYKPESFWLINNGNGGFVGKYLTGSFLSSAIDTNNTVYFYFLIIFIVYFFY